MALSVKTQKFLKRLLIMLLVAFSLVSVVFSVKVLFSDLNPKREATQAQASGIFTAFIYQYINEVHPVKLPPGRSWVIQSIEFPNAHSAIVESSDKQTRSRLEFIFAIESPNIPVLKITDLTNRDVEDARLALTRYYDFLRNADYENAALYYGGPVAPLVRYGGDQAPLPKLLQGYCESNTPGKRCLSFTISEGTRGEAPDTYTFTVNYYQADNTRFDLPDGISDFTAHVEQRAGNIFVVDTLPFD